MQDRGFQVGDITVSVDARPVHNTTEFIDSMHQYDSTTEVALRVDDEERKVAIIFLD